ncbi:Adenylate kinase 8 [Boothiomyces sp. JEL0866]|nr:Adenylate kinase 8 [Boothiomyces sp. JEL0866]
MKDIVTQEKLEAFANYADRHEIYDLFKDTVSALMVSRPADPFQFMMDYFTKPPGKSILVIEGIANRLNVVYINVGKLLEVAYEKQKTAGVQARPFIERGQLVPDAIITSIVLGHLKEQEVVERGYVLDGYPRTKNQAMALLQAGHIPGHVVEIDVSDSEIIHKNFGIKSDISKQRELALNKPADDGIKRKGEDLTTALLRLKLYRQYIPAALKCFKLNHRKFKMENDSDGTEVGITENICRFLSIKQTTNAPRGLKIIVAGLPGSGKTSVAEFISQTFGAVLVSTKKVMLEKISAGYGEKYLGYIKQPDLVPLEIIGEDMIARLKRRDCLERGWVLDGYPFNHKEAEFLQKHGIAPNRRYDPNTSRVVNLMKIPNDLKNVDFEKWIHTKQDQNEYLETKFEIYDVWERELMKVYNLKENNCPTGIMHYIESEGVGEADENGENPSLERLFELVEGHLLRPIPSQVQ